MVSSLLSLPAEIGIVSEGRILLLLDFGLKVIIYMIKYYIIKSGFAQKPTIQTVVKLAKALKVSLDELVKEKERN